MSAANAVVDYLTPRQTRLRPEGEFRERWTPSLLASDAPLSRGVLLGTFAAICLLYGLLYSSHWYPLSDSSLYLYLAKNLAAGKDIEFTRQIHKSIRPYTPLLLSWVLKAGGGIGAIHVVMIVLTLVSHVLAFLTLRRWFNERIAFWAMVLTAASWWVYANAFTIMTEPPFLTFFWACMLALSYVGAVRSGWGRWGLVIFAAVMLAGSWTNRVAAILLVPGVCLGVFMAYRNIARWPMRLAWAGVFVVLAGLMVLDYKRPIEPLPGAQPQKAGGIPVIDVADKDGVAGHLEEGYRMNVLSLKSPWVKIPVNGGRWVLEMLAAPLVAPYNANGTTGLLGAIVALVTLALFITGWVKMGLGGYWWAAAMPLYFIPVWIMWGARVKPRYMIPIAPILFILFWAGMNLAWRGLTRLMKRRAAANAGRAYERPRTAWVALTALVFVSFTLNGFAYGVEIYIRHSDRDFYDLARRGSYAELLDICAYLKKNAPMDAQVWLNRGASRRIVGLMTDRAVFTVKREVEMEQPEPAKLNLLFSRVKGRYVIVFYGKLQQFHWPIAGPPPTDGKPRWWQLFELNPKTKKYEPVTVPPDRETIREVTVYDRSRR